MFRKILITILICFLVFAPVLAEEDESSWTDYPEAAFAESGWVGGSVEMLEDGVCELAILLFGDCSSESQAALDALMGGGSTLDGVGAIGGLEVFEDNYKGNTYGSAIGMITGWTNFVLPFVSAIAIVALVYAGFLYLTAFGNDEQSSKAKKIIMWVVVGIILIISSYAIVNTLIQTDGSSSASDDDDDDISIDIGGIEVDF